MTAIPNKVRSPHLDLLRAIAVLLVIGHHYVFPYTLSRSTMPAWANFLDHVGWTGVDLFFVLSGFLVSGLLFAEFTKFGEIHPVHFLIRRGFKIYPGFYVLLAATVILRGIAGHLRQPLQVCAEIFFIQNYLPGLWVHTWSLAVEEHFYITLAIVSYLIVRTRRDCSYIAWLAAFVMVFSLVARACQSFELFYSGPIGFATHFRADSLMAGVLISYFFHFKAAKLRSSVSRLSRALPVCGILMVAFATSFDRHSVVLQTVGFTVLYLGYSCILLWTLFLRVDTIANEHFKGLIVAIASMGRQSYSIYLWHLAVGQWLFDRLFGKSHPASLLIVYAAASVLVGTVMAHIIEFPVLRIRERLVPPRSENTSTSTEAIANQAVGASA